jgi:tetratricopeptide (TPR) repeat protein
MTMTRLEALQKFLEKEPNDSFTRYAIALEYASLNDPHKAVSSLEELIKSDRDYVPAYQQLGSILAGLDRKKEALKILEQGVQIATTNGDLHAAQEMKDAVEEIGEE